MLAIITRNAVVLGLVYALVWETIVGQIVPGARNLSVQQWALSIAERLAGSDASRWEVESAVSLSTGVMLLACALIGACAIATRRLRHLSIGPGE
jgi:ABC-2 type transport system permease protein